MNHSLSIAILGLFLGSTTFVTTGCGDDAEGVGGATGSTSASGSSTVGMTLPQAIGEARVYLANATDAEITVNFDSVAKGSRILPGRSAGWVKSPVFGDDGCIGSAPCVVLGIQGINGLTQLTIDAAPGSAIIVPLHGAASVSYDSTEIPQPGADMASMVYQESSRFGTRDDQGMFVPLLDEVDGLVDAASEVFFLDPTDTRIALQDPTPFTAGKRYYVRGSSEPDAARLLVCDLADDLPDGARCIDDLPIE